MVSLVICCAPLWQMWHQDYRNFRETTVFMVTGLELFHKAKYDDTFPNYLLMSNAGKHELSPPTVSV